MAAMTEGRRQQQANGLRSASLKACLNSPTSDSTDEEDRDQDGEQDAAGQSRLTAGFSMPFIDKLAALWTGRESHESEDIVPPVTSMLALSCPSGVHLSEASCSCSVLGPLRTVEPIALNLSPGAVARDRIGVLQTFPWQNTSGLRMATPRHQRAVEHLAVRVAQRKQSMRDQHLVAARSMQESLHVEQEHESQRPATTSTLRGIAESFRLPARAKAKLGTTVMRRSRSAEATGSSIRRFSGVKRVSPSPDSHSLPAFVRWTQALLPKRARSAQPQAAGPAGPPPQSARSARNLIASGKSAKQPTPAPAAAHQPARPARRQRPQQQQQPRQRQQQQRQQQQQQRQRQQQQLRVPSSRITYVHSQESSQSNYLRPTVSGRSSLGQYASFQYTPSADSTNWEFSARPAERSASGPDALDADERDVIMSRIARRASKTQALDRPLSPFPEHQGSASKYYHTAASPPPPTFDRQRAPSQHAPLEPLPYRRRHAEAYDTDRAPAVRQPYRQQHAESYAASDAHAHAPRQAEPYARRHAGVHASQPAHEPQRAHASQQPLPYRRRHAEAYTAQQAYLASPQHEAAPHAARQADWDRSQRAPPISGPPASYYPGSRMHSHEASDAAHRASLLRPQPINESLVPNGTAEGYNGSAELAPIAPELGSSSAQQHSALHPMQLVRRRSEAALQDPPDPNMEASPEIVAQPLAAASVPSAFSRRGVPAARPALTTRLSSPPPHHPPLPASPYPANLTRSEAVLAHGTIPGFSPPTPPLDFAEPRGLMQPDDSSEASQSPRLIMEDAAAHAEPAFPQQRPQQTFNAGPQTAGQPAEHSTPVRQAQSPPPATPNGMRSPGTHAWPSRAARQRQGPLERGHNPLLPASDSPEAGTPPRQLEDIQALVQELRQLRSRPRHDLAPFEMTRYLELKLKLATQQQQQVAASDFVPTTPLQTQLMPSAAHRRGASPPRGPPSTSHASNPLLSSPSQASALSGRTAPRRSFASGAMANGGAYTGQGRRSSSAAPSVVSEDSHAPAGHYGSVEGSLPSEEASIKPSPWARRGKGRISHSQAPPAAPRRAGFDAAAPLNGPPPPGGATAGLGTVLLDEVASASDHSRSQDTGGQERESSAELAAQQQRPSPYARSFVPASARQRHAHRHGMLPHSHQRAPAAHQQQQQRRALSSQQQQQQQQQQHAVQNHMRHIGHASGHAWPDQRPAAAHTSTAGQHAGRGISASELVPSDLTEDRPRSAQPYQRRYQPSHSQAGSVASDDQPGHVGHRALQPAAHASGRDAAAQDDRAAYPVLPPSSKRHEDASHYSGRASGAIAPGGRADRGHDNAWASWRDPEATHMDEARFMPVIDKKWSQLVKASKSAKRNGMVPAQRPNAQQQQQRHQQQQQPQQHKHMMLGTKFKAKND